MGESRRAECMKSLKHSIKQNCIRVWSLEFNSDLHTILRLPTAAHRQTRAWNAVEYFYQPFAFNNPDKPHTDIVLLVVCDMLVTGFERNAAIVACKVAATETMNDLAPLGQVRRGQDGVADSGICQQHEGNTLFSLSCCPYSAPILMLYIMYNMAQRLPAGIKRHLSGELGGAGMPYPTPPPVRSPRASNHSNGRKA